MVIRDLGGNVEKEEFLAALSGALGKSDLNGSCRLYTRFCGVRIAVVQLAEVDALHLLQLGKIRVRWVNFRIREHAEVAWCSRYQGTGHVSLDCIYHSRKDTYLRCSGLMLRANE